MMEVLDDPIDSIIGGLLAVCGWSRLELGTSLCGVVWLSFYSKGFFDRA